MSDVAQAQEENAFRHKPLELTKQQVRLFKFESVSSPNPSIMIFYFDLDIVPPYSALSYEWGEPNIKPVQVNNTILHIRENLWHFLNRICVERSDHWLWADQISINQHSMAERSQQVQIMNQIYRDAEDVVIWLGSDVHFWQDSLRLQSNNIQAIISASYWRRLWVVQELLLAREVYFAGPYNLASWESIEKTAKSASAVPGTDF
jgi:hypothetical protein